MSKSLLKIKSLKKSFPVEKDFWGRTTKSLKAVSNVSLEIQKGECLALVGESGSGKSTLARLILRLIKADNGEIAFISDTGGIDLFSLKPVEMRRLRKEMQMIFQNPYSSLDPRFRIFDTIAEPLIVHGERDPEKIRRRVFELLELVDLSKDLAYRYPHECSGGQRQRVGIARALALNPKFIIADEAVSALDVSVQAKILKLLKDLQEKLGLTFLFIAHNLGVVREISDRVAVMYLGEIVEVATSAEIFENPLHPYTKALFSSAPIPDPNMRDREKFPLEGEVPSPIDIPSGCPFHTRCPIAEARCSTIKPNLEDKNGRMVSCLLA